MRDYQFDTTTTLQRARTEGWLVCRMRHLDCQLALLALPESKSSPEYKSKDYLLGFAILSVLPYVEAIGWSSSTWAARRVFIRAGQHSLDQCEMDLVQSRIKAINQIKALGGASSDIVPSMFERDLLPAEAPPQNQQPDTTMF